MRITSGPAFPTRVRTNVSLDPEAPIYADGHDPGMTLRDYFAAQAIPVLVSTTADGDGGWDAVAVAVGCYALADALLAARETAEGGRS